MTWTDNFGVYYLYGVAGTTSIKVTKDGYVPQVKTITVDSHQTLNIELPLLTPRADVSGTYTLRLVSAPECVAGPEPLPEEARSRTYTAVLTQLGAEVSVVLGGATFYAGPGGTSNRMSGRVNPKGVTFDMTWSPWDDPFPPVAETMATEAILLVSGTAPTTISPGRLSGPLSGDFLVYPPGADIRAGGTRATAQCKSNNHQFLLSR